MHNSSSVAQIQRFLFIVFFHFFLWDLIEFIAFCELIVDEVFQISLWPANKDNPKYPSTTESKTVYVGYPPVELIWTEYENIFQVGSWRKVQQESRADNINMK